MGPLVALTKRDDKGRHLVTDEYADFSKIEREGGALRQIIEGLHRTIISSGVPVTPNFCGIPEGGRTLATLLAAHFGGSFIYPEKEVTKLKTPNSREESRLGWGRHEPRCGEDWFPVDDIFTNGSTTDRVIKLIEGCGARVPAVICFLNRSVDFDRSFLCRSRNVPIIALVRKRMEQYSQDDPKVAHDVVAGNVVLNPKKEWSQLVSAMARTQIKGSGEIIRDLADQAW